MKKMASLILMAMSTIGLLAHPIVSSQLFEIPLSVSHVDPTTGHGGYPRTPVNVPHIAIDGHTLYLYNVGYDLTLRLLDEDGEEVYTVTVAAGTTSVELPATLTGPHTLQLFPGGSYYFEGIINF